MACISAILSQTMVFDENERHMNSGTPREIQWEFSENLHGTVPKGPERKLRRERERVEAGLAYIRSDIDKNYFRQCVTQKRSVFRCWRLAAKTQSACRAPIRWRLFGARVLFAPQTFAVEQTTRYLCHVMLLLLLLLLLLLRLRVIMMPMSAKRSNEWASPETTDSRVSELPPLLHYFDPSRFALCERKLPATAKTSPMLDAYTWYNHRSTNGFRGCVASRASSRISSRLTVWPIRDTAAPWRTNREPCRVYCINGVRLPWFGVYTLDDDHSEAILESL